MAPSADPRVAAEAARRRTFGIISHPDAGKTTLTERLLLLGGAIHLAGDVRARKTNRYAASDWLAIEQQRGISVTASAMQFDYAGRTVNLLDTPGHEDFSEDTYRVLTAVDSALMVIDAVKGVESRTRQLMEVCRLRDTPILTFINKLDREGRDAFDLLQDIEESLGIAAAPLAWPVGMGGRLRGLYLLRERAFLPVAPGGGGGEPVPLSGPDDPALEALVGARDAATLAEEIELLEGAGAPFALDDYLAGRQTPVFFGIALGGLGVQAMLDTFVEIAPPPRPRETASRTVRPEEPRFTGLVFKVQANMDPAHRDRVAFVRVCSGRFERGLRVQHQRAGRDLRVSNAVLFQARERAGVEEAYPGDIVGIPNHGTLRIGDTLTEGEALRFTGIPSFAPEHFRKVRIENALKAKPLEKGVRHLTEEGAIQLYRPLHGNDYILGAVGPLQFDVVAGRLASEYGVEVTLTPLPYVLARWVVAESEAALARFSAAEGHRLARDADGDLVFLAESTFWLDRAADQYPSITFASTKEHGVETPA
ncbi:MAG: peptide chain release factor 3 [Rubricoccaceae bacterium]